jgi:hypothetical protein
MSHFEGHFEGASTFLTLNWGQKSLGPLKMSLEMAHKVLSHQKKIISRSFLNSGTLIVILGCRIAYKGAMDGARGGEYYISKPLWSSGKIYASGPEENHFVSGNFAGFSLYILLEGSAKLRREGRRHYIFCVVILYIIA